MDKLKLLTIFNYKLLVILILGFLIRQVQNDGFVLSYGVLFCTVPMVSIFILKVTENYKAIAIINFGIFYLLLILTMLVNNAKNGQSIIAAPLIITYVLIYWPRVLSLVLLGFLTVFLGIIGVVYPGDQSEEFFWIEYLQYSQISFMIILMLPIFTYIDKVAPTTKLQYQGILKKWVILGILTVALLDICTQHTNYLSLFYVALLPLIGLIQTRLYQVLLGVTSIVFIAFNAYTYVGRGYPQYIEFTYAAVFFVLFIAYLWVEPKIRQATPRSDSVTPMT